MGATKEDFTGNWKKLNDGSWGAWISPAPEKGDEATLTKRSGEESYVRVTEVVWAKDDGSGSICRVEEVILNAPPRPSGPSLARPQGKTPFQEGQILVARLRPSEVEHLEAEQGFEATDIPPAPENDRRRVVVKVVEAWSYTADQVEDFDAWSHQHNASILLASPEEAAPTLEARVKALEEKERKEQEERRKQEEWKAAKAEVLDELERVGGRGLWTPRSTAGAEEVASGGSTWRHNGPRFRLYTHPDYPGTAYVSDVDHGSGGTFWATRETARRINLEWAEEADITVQRAKRFAREYGHCAGWQVHADVLVDAGVISSPEEYEELHEEGALTVAGKVKPRVKEALGLGRLDAIPDDCTAYDDAITAALEVLDPDVIGRGTWSDETRQRVTEAIDAVLSDL